MKKQKVNRQVPEDISVSDAKRVGRALYNHCLSQKWLQMRLDRDWGIKIHTSQLSEVLDGKRAIGPKMRLVIWCSQQIIAQYEEFYGSCKDCGKKEKGEKHDAT